MLALVLVSLFIAFIFFRLVLLVNFCDVAFVLSSIELSSCVGLVVTEKVKQKDWEICARMQSDRLSVLLMLL